MSDRPSPASGTAVLMFPAEVDLAGVDRLREQALGLLNRGASMLVLDLSQCRFCDSSGVNLILRVRTRAVAMGVPLEVVLPARGAARRVCELTGVPHVVPTRIAAEPADSLC
ncbi:STAS domain-containing protein [Spirillospora sp. NPDC050679]